MASSLPYIQLTPYKPQCLPFVTMYMKRQLMPEFHTEFEKGQLAFRFMLVKFIPSLSKI